MFNGVYKINYKWPIEEGNYITGNPTSPCAVITPITDKTIWKISIDAGANIAGGLLTANIGIEKIVKNIISNPNIRYIVLFGDESEGHNSGDALYNLWKNGIDENKKIIGTKACSPFLKNVSDKAIKRFRNQIIAVIDYLGTKNTEKIKQVIKATYQEEENAVKLKDNRNQTLKIWGPGKFNGKPIIEDANKILERNKVISHTYSMFMTTIYAKTISDAWNEIIYLIETQGKLIYDERGDKRKELINFSVHIENPLEKMIPEGYYMNKNALENYTNQLRNPDKRGFEYTYGERLFNYKGINQIDNYIIPKLKKSKNTRRAIAVLWNPEIDTKKDEVPCINLIDFQIKKNILHLTAVIRANEMEFAWPANAYGLAKLLEYVSHKIGVKCGTLTTISINAHIFPKKEYENI